MLFFPAEEMLGLFEERQTSNSGYERQPQDAGHKLVAEVLITLKKEKAREKTKGKVNLETLKIGEKAKEVEKDVLMSKWVSCLLYTSRCV